MRRRPWQIDSDKRTRQDQKLPTKLLVPAAPTRDKAKNHQKNGVTGHGAGQSGVIENLAAVGPFIDDADAEKEAAGRDPVIDHLHHRAFNP